MEEFEIRPMRAEDWVPATIEPGRYCNARPLTGFRRRGGGREKPLHPACGDEEFEGELLKTHAALRAMYPGIKVARYVVQMPYWKGHRLPGPGDYRWVDAPQSLTTTSITVAMVPNERIRKASMGYYFEGNALPTLRARMAGVRFQGLAGNLGYYMTADLIEGKPWAHNARYPAFPLPNVLSYIGFHWTKGGATGKVYGAFEGAHPAAVGIRENGEVEILPELGITAYGVQLAGQSIAVHAINTPDAVDEPLVLFTPALKTPEVERYIAAAEASAGTAEGWKTHAPMIPLADADDRVHVFIANEGDGRVPVEKAVAVWEGRSPVPSFGGVLSFKRDCFAALFGSMEAFKRDALGQRVQIVPSGAVDFDDYVQIMGGLVPTVVHGEHVYCLETVDGVMKSLNRYGNATSPIAEAGRETRNYDPRIREPAGVLVQTRDRIGWVTLDGRHELSIGASVVDVAMMLKKVEMEGGFGEGGIRQAVFIDGGSAMKAYHVQSDGRAVTLDLLNRVAAGSRNGPGEDDDGLNLYTLLALDM
jgi:hypothetical protein